ncbi:unnamed protein product [Lactuca virosa]|uniref:Ig-like domain-containing protein n=1 Tax=Lactuca virosa TaxID=75947 RepID=A0AAU9P1F0_9ASTR|nr:unnamed protein product [Lactuca virosa]
MLHTQPPFFRRLHSHYLWPLSKPSTSAATSSSSSTVAAVASSSAWLCLPPTRTIVPSKPTTTAAKTRWEKDEYASSGDTKLLIVDCSSPTIIAGYVAANNTDDHRTPHIRFRCISIASVFRSSALHLFFPFSPEFRNACSVHNRNIHIVFNDIRSTPPRSKVRWFRSSRNESRFINTYHLSIVGVDLEA